MRGFFLCVAWMTMLAYPITASGNHIEPVAAAMQRPAPKPEEVPRPREAPAPDETPKPGSAPVTEVPTPRGELSNVRLDVTIADQRADGQPTSKTVSLVLADRANGRIRTMGDVRVPVGGGNYQMRSVVLNVDAYPEFTRDGRVRARVTLEYRPVAAEGTNITQEPALTTISETFTVILSDGKPLVVSQSADPTTDRRVRVEVKATILK